MQQLRLHKITHLLIRVDGGCPVGTASVPSQLYMFVLRFVITFVLRIVITFVLRFVIIFVLMFIIVFVLLIIAHTLPIAWLKIN